MSFWVGGHMHVHLNSMESEALMLGTRLDSLHVSFYLAVHSHPLTSFVITQ